MQNMFTVAPFVRRKNEWEFKADGVRLGKNEGDQGHAIRLPSAGRICRIRCSVSRTIFSVRYNWATQKQCVVYFLVAKAVSFFFYDG